MFCLTQQQISSEAMKFNRYGVEPRLGNVLWSLFSKKTSSLSPHTLPLPSSQLCRTGVGVKTNEENPSFLFQPRETQVESEQGLAGGGREDKRVISTQMSLGNLLFPLLCPNSLPPLLEHWNNFFPPPSSNAGDIWLDTSICLP